MTASVKLQDVPLFQGLAPRSLEAFKSCLKEKAFKKGDILFSEGASCERIFILKSGHVKMIRTASTGREQILEVLNAGDTCACHPGNLEWFCSSTAEASTDGVAWFLSRADYVNFVRNNVELSHSLNEIFAKRLKCFMALIEEVSLKDVKKRLVKFLLDMQKEKNNDGESQSVLFIPFTREEIAQRLGTARETIARYLSQLNKDGFIEIKPYQIEILDRKGLEALLK